MEVWTDEILNERMVAELCERTGLTNLRPGGRLVRLLGTFSRRLAEAHNAAWGIRDGFFWGTSQGADALARGADLLPEGMDRLLGSLATGGAVRFTRPAGATLPETTFPAGTVVWRKRNNLRYMTTAAITAADGATASPPVSVVASQAGSIGNCAADEIKFLGSPITGWTGCTNTAAIANGTDLEDIADYKSRGREWVKAIARATLAAQAQAALNYSSPRFGKVRFVAFGPAEATDRGGYLPMYIDDGAGTAGPVEAVVGDLVLAAAVGGERVLYTSKRPIVPGSGYRLARVPSGGDPEDPEYPTGVEVVEPWGQIRLPSPYATAGDLYELRSFSCWGGLVAEVQNIIDGDLDDPVARQGYRAAGIVTQVRPATRASLTISIVLVLDPTFDATLTLALLRDKIVGFVNGIGIGKPVYRAALESLLMREPGVRNVTKVLINGVASDYYTATGTVARVTSSDVALG